MTSLSHSKVKHELINAVVWLNLETPWDVPVFKVVVFSTDMDQIISAHLSLQGNLFVELNIYLEVLLGFFFGANVKHIFIQCYIFAIFILCFS